MEPAGCQATQPKTAFFTRAEKRTAASAIIPIALIITDAMVFWHPALGGHGGALEGCIAMSGGNTWAIAVECRFFT